VDFTSQWNSRLSQYEAVVQSSIDKWHEREVQEKGDRATKAVEVVTRLLSELEGRVPREVVRVTLEKALGATFDMAAISQESPRKAPELISTSGNDMPGIGMPATLQENDSPMPINIETIIKRVEPDLKRALATYSDTDDAIRSVLPAINIARKLDTDDKDSLFDEWSKSKVGKLKSGNAKDVLETFLREQQNAGHVILE
jgi:hypothetical protein